MVLPEITGEEESLRIPYGVPAEPPTITLLEIVGLLEVRKNPAFTVPETAPPTTLKPSITVVPVKGTSKCVTKVASLG